MTIRKGVCASLIGLMTLALLGCAPKMTIEQMKEMKPVRPAALDKLNAFAGEWKGTATMTMAGLDQTLKSTGTSKSTWECDGWVLVEHGTMETEELGSYEMLGIWTYDPTWKVYRNHWYSSYGEVGEGTARFDEKTNTWKMKGTTKSEWGTTHGKGTAKFVTDDKVDWSWTERAMLGLVKVMDMEGTTERK